MNEPVIKAKEISMTLGSGAGAVNALKNVSLSLRSGEIALLMGPSGSGKTTLLLVLGCMLVPSAGTVHICDVSTTGAAPEWLARLRRKHIGFVFQNYHLFPTLTAAENVQLALDVRGEHGPRARDRTHNALARVGLSKKLKAFPRELSGGEQQRVAIARALVSNPSVILADEPTAALDSCNGQAIMNILADISVESGSSVLVVTHDSRLTSFADRILSIEDGRLVSERFSNTAARKHLAVVAGQ